MRALQITDDGLNQMLREMCMHTPSLQRWSGKISAWAKDKSQRAARRANGLEHSRARGAKNRCSSGQGRGAAAAMHMQTRMQARGADGSVASDNRTIGPAHKQPVPCLCSPAWLLFKVLAVLLGHHPAQRPETSKPGMGKLAAHSSTRRRTSAMTGLASMVLRATEGEVWREGGCQGGEVCERAGADNARAIDSIVLRGG